MISKIYHIADVHIRLYKRHKEYEQVFKKLFKFIEETKDEDSIILLAGDIVHNKTDMTPELIQVTSAFLKRCSDLLPTILICGNHDANLANSHRLDALSPIVNSLNHPNLHYWKDSGIYKFGGITFSVFGILDSSDKWVLAKDIKSKYKIALYHGPICGSLTDLTTIESGMNLDKFSGFDLGLLGDIHTQQFLNEEKTIAYAGSCIQQNHGESVDKHGLLVWDVKKRKAEFVSIKNDFGYYTFYIINGNCNVPDGLPKNLRVRIKYENTLPEQIEEVIQRISKKYTILELVKQKTMLSDSTNLSKENILGNSRDVEYQNKIISDYLLALGEISEDELREVLQLNVETNRLLPIHTKTRNVTWRPIKLEFSNMFSYGEDNTIGFNNLKGSYGIFSKNADGKSSVLDILSFVIYDKTTRTNKGSHILNINKDSFYCKLQFDLNGREYFIERIGSKNNTNGAVRVNVNFWTYDEFGEKVSLNGEDRDKTNFVIRDLLGTYDDFVMTALSTQYDNQNFVEKTQRDRKELLYKFLDIFIYDDLYKLAKENSREFQVLIRELEKDNLHERSSEIYQTISNLEIGLNETDDRINQVRQIIKEKTDLLFDLNKQYVSIGENLDIDRIEQELSNCSSDLLQIVRRTKEIQNSIVEYTEETNTLNLEFQYLSKFEDLAFYLRQLNNTFSQITKLEKDLLDLKNKINHCENKKNQLESHKYDPECKFCVNNEFVIDAEKSIKILPELRKEYSEREITLSEIELTSKCQNEDLDKAKRFESLKNQISRNERELAFLKDTEESLKFKGKTVQSQIKDLQNKKVEYIKNSAIITKNVEILSNISSVKQEIDLLESKEKQLQTKHRDKYSEIERKKKDYESCIISLNKYADFIKKNRIYDLYLQALSRDGVPYKIVETILPVLENEVNLILNSVVNFTIKLEATDEKYIHAYIVYSGSNSWPVELSSGMERFILSLAFRAAMSEITSLPKANFLAVDEGFGVLDSENILQMGNLFQFLKNQYEYLICISHIDSMKDLVDNQIKIEKIDGYSRLKYNDTI